MTMISIIAAIDERRGIGRDNKLLWHIPEDLARFKRITFGHPVIMGRKTYLSIGRPLPGRTNIIISRNKKYKAKDCIVCNSLEKAFKFAKSKDKKEIFIIGGGEIYKQAIGWADKLYLTIVKGDFRADTFFPEYQEFNKMLAGQKMHNNKHQYQFLELTK